MSARDANLLLASSKDADAAYRRKLGDDVHHMFCSGRFAPCQLKCGDWDSLNAAAAGVPSIQALKLRQDDRAYYGRKWGDLPGFERFTQPFNDKKNAVGFWPEPKPRVPREQKPFAVRLYGNFATNGSFGRVSRGLEEGLAEMGLLAGRVEVDSVDASELEEADGADATIGIYAGAPARVGVMTSYGAHCLNFAILAPNSSWLPDKLVRDMLQRACVVAPSSWGARVLASYTNEMIVPLTHGVSKDFSPVPELHEDLERQCDEGVFRVLHLTSTMRQRKATREVVLAWKHLLDSGQLNASGAELHILADAPDGTFESGPNVIYHGPSNSPVAKMREIYQRCHLVVQPSRAEGFGMVPLEARACGIPVVATACTGHMDHMGGFDEGCVVVGSGSLEPIDDGPGALAPSVTVEQVTASLGLAHSQWKYLHAAALRYAPVVRHEWSWSHRLVRWINATGVREL